MCFNMHVEVAEGVGPSMVLYAYLNNNLAITPRAWVCYHR